MIFLFLTGGEFHQYDSVAYPHIAEASSGLIQRGWNMFTRSSSQSKIQDILDQPSMQSEALRIYLKSYKMRLCKFEFSSLDAEIATSDILHIFQSLRYVHNCVGNCNNPKKSEYKIVSKVRYQVNS